YTKLGRPDRAEDSLLQASALSDAPEVALKLGELYVAQRRYKDAETLLVEGIRRHPETGDLYHALGTVYFAQGRDDEAEALAKQAHLKPHTIADVHLLLAKIYLKRRDLAAVADQLEVYLREAPAGPTSAGIKKDLEK